MRDRPSGWYQTGAETAAVGGVAGTVWRWWDAERQVWTQYVENGPGPAPKEYRRTVAAAHDETATLTLPRTMQVGIPTP